MSLDSSEPATPRHVRGTGRDALIRATIQAVGELGLGQATVRRIAERAHVDNSLVTHHFGSREGLLAAASELSLREQLRLADVTVDIVLDGRQRVITAQTVAIDPTIAIFQYEMILAARHNTHLHAIVSRHYDSCIQRMRRSLSARSLPDDEILARALFALVDGLVLQQATTVSTSQQTIDALGRAADILRSACLPALRGTDTQPARHISVPPEPEA